MNDHDQIQPGRGLTRIFQPDTATALLRARSAFDAAESQISDFKTARDVALKNLDDESAVAEVQRLDHEIEAHQHAASIYHERIGALLERQREDERGNREAEKAAAVAEVGKRLARRQSAARKFDEATEVFIAEIAKLQAADAAVFSDWPAILPLMDAGTKLRNHRSFLSKRLTRDDFAREIGHYGTLEVRGTLCGMLEIGSFAMAAAARAIDASILDDLRQYQIPEPEPTDLAGEEDGDEYEQPEAEEVA